MVPYESVVSQLPQKATSKLQANINVNVAATFKESINASIAFLGATSDTVWNMDETSVLFNPCPDSSIAVSGGKSISIHVPGNEKLRCPVTFTISAARKKHTPVIIFKGEKRPPRFNPPYGVFVVFQKVA